MLVLHRNTGVIEHKMFTDLPSYLKQGDLLMLNDTKVIPARLYSNDESIELVVIERPSLLTWIVMVRPGKKMKVGRTVEVGSSKGTVKEILENGNRVIEWDSAPDLEQHGTLALPHYMKRESNEIDQDRYQTVFAKEEGAIAAPTAGLHFTPELLETLDHDFLTLHVGIGTFRPVKVEEIKDHEMHTERYILQQSAAEKMNQAERIVAVGTTVTRVLESLGRETGTFSAVNGETDIFLYPPYDFKVVGALLTNFHLPKSTLIMLVSSFAGRELIKRAYAEAVKEEYRFFSYGDCMLIL